MFCNLCTVMTTRNGSFSAMFTIAVFRNVIHLNTNANSMQLKVSSFALWEPISTRNLRLAEDYF